jgi:hypothetical protein
VRRSGVGFERRLSAALVAPIVALGAGLLGGEPAAAAQMLSMEVERDGDRYRVDSHTLLQAPAEAVFDVLSDYDRLHELSSVFEETRTVERSADGSRQIVYLRARGCVLFFCKTLERYEQLSLSPYREIVAEAIAPPPPAPAGDASGSEPGTDAAEGDDVGQIAYARSTWRLEEQADGTHVYYAMEMEPDFWVPPLVGPWALKRKLSSGAGDAAERLERRALGQPLELE